MSGQWNRNNLLFLKSKLAKRLSLYVLGVAIATALVVSAIQAVWKYHIEKEQLQKEFGQIEKINLKSIEENLWILNITALHTTLKGLLQKENFVYFKLTDEHKQTLVEVGKRPHDHFLLKTLPLYHQDSHTSKVYLGRLTMVATTVHIRNNIVYNTLSTLFIFLVTMLLVGFFILLLVWFLITKHLFEIQQYTHQIRFDREMPPLQLKRKINHWTKHDVLTSLVQTINKMRKLIHDSYLRLEYQSLHDTLTDLPNRRSLEINLNQQIEAMKDHQKYAALYFIDLDSFKVLNDSLGHTVGDRVLVEIAERLKTLEEQKIQIYRIGGDEFLALTPPLSQKREKAHQLAHTFAEAIQELFAKEIRLEEKTLKITASIGIELFQKGEEIETIMKHADNALYKAKERGRNTISFFNKQMQASADRQLELEQWLHYAIEHDAFIIHYQAKFDREQRLSSAEALTRLKKKDGSLISPQLFIPLAEETGLILEIDRKVIRQVFQFIHDYKEKIEKSGMKSMAINISSAQFLMVDFPQYMMREVNRFGIDPHFIILEITEETVVSNVEHAIETMLELKQYGFQFSIDDFGTGYSSLRYLMNFPLDELKIDKSFVDHILINEQSAAVVQTIITLAQNLHLNVIAEGVEEQTQFQALYHYGSTLFQGYLFSRPLPEEAFLKLLDEQ